MDVAIAAATGTNKVDHIEGVVDAAAVDAQQQEQPPHHIGTALEDDLATLRALRDAVVDRVSHRERSLARIDAAARTVRQVAQEASWLVSGALDGLDTDVAARKRVSLQADLCARQLTTLLRSLRANCVLAVRSALEAHIERYLSFDLQQRHSSGTKYGELVVDFQLHMSYFTGELAALLGSHCDTVAAAVRDALRVLGVAGMSLPFDVDVAHLVRAPTPNASALRQPVAPKFDLVASDVLMLVPLVQFYYLLYRDRRTDFKNAVTERRGEYVEKLCTRVSADLEQMHARIEATVARALGMYDDLTAAFSADGVGTLDDAPPALRTALLGARRDCAAVAAQLDDLL